MYCSTVELFCKEVTYQRARTSGRERHNPLTLMLPAEFLCISQDKSNLLITCTSISVAAALLPETCTCLRLHGHMEVGLAIWTLIRHKHTSVHSWIGIGAVQDLEHRTTILISTQLLIFRYELMALQSSHPIYRDSNLCVCVYLSFWSNSCTTFLSRPSGPDALHLHPCHHQ